MIRVVKNARKKERLEVCARHKRTPLIDLLLKIKVQQEIQLLSLMLMKVLVWKLTL
jgi:hypothetical protein